MNKLAILRVDKYVKMRRSLILLLFSAAVVMELTSCQGLFMNKRAKMVLKDGKGLLRGVELDITQPEVKKIEKDSLNEESPAFLGYLEPGVEKGEKLEVEYSFNDQGKLDLISAFYYLDKDEDAEKMVAELRKYFEKKLGPSKKDELGWFTWQYRDKKGIPGDVEIVLNKKVESKSKVVDLEIVKYYDSEATSSRTLKK